MTLHWNANTVCAHEPTAHGWLLHLARLLWVHHVAPRKPQPRALRWCMSLRHIGTHAPWIFHQFLFCSACFQGTKTPFIKYILDLLCSPKPLYFNNLNWKYLNIFEHFCTQNPVPGRETTPSQSLDYLLSLYASHMCVNFKKYRVLTMNSFSRTMILTRHVRG